MRQKCFDHNTQTLVVGTRGEMGHNHVLICYQEYGVWKFLNHHARKITVAPAIVKNLLNIEWVQDTPIAMVSCISIQNLGYLDIPRQWRKETASIAEKGWWFPLVYRQLFGDEWVLDLADIPIKELVETAHEPIRTQVGFVDGELEVIPVHVKE